MPLLTELENVLGCDSTKMSPLTGLAAVWFLLDKIFTRRKFQIMKRKKHTCTLREELEDLNDYLDLTEARVRDEGKPRLTHAEVKKRYGVK